MEKSAIRTTRADDLATPGVIMDQIADQIGRSEYSVADITGQNPNVMYEVGIATTLGKSPILISQKDFRIPFDVAAQRILMYDNTLSGFRKFEQELASFINWLKDSKRK